MHHKLLIFLVALFSFAGTVLAQDHQEVQKQFETQFQEMDERLELTDAQREELRPILESHFHEAQAVLEKHGLDKRQTSSPGPRKLMALRSDMQPLNEQTDRRVGAVLSDEQMDEYRDIQEERRARMRARLRG
jgi:hypothetical protein